MFKSLHPQHISPNSLATSKADSPIERSMAVSTEQLVVLKLESGTLVVGDGGGDRGREGVEG